MRKFFAVAMLAALGLPKVGAAADQVDIDWGTAQRFELQRRVDAGKTLEVCGLLRKDQPIDWQFVASEPMAFKLHHRVGKQLSYVERRQRTKSLTMRLVPEKESVYCWGWTAPGPQAVTLQLLLRY